MGDQLENFILKNRVHFEDDIKGDQLWNRIEKDLGEQKPFTFITIWKVAAAILLISTVFLSIDKFSNSKNEPALYAEFQQAELFYSTLILDKREEITLFGIDGLTDDFLKEIDDLDAMYLELKRTFDEKTSDQKLINAMIENLQLRIQILNKQLSILQQLNEKRNENYTTI